MRSYGTTQKQNTTLPIASTTNRMILIHGVNGEKFRVLNFDDERLVKIQNFYEILEAIMAVYGNHVSLLLNEIQNLPDWELIVNRLQRQGFHGLDCNARLSSSLPLCGC